MMSKTVNKIEELTKALQVVEELAKELEDTVWQSPLEVLKDESHTFFEIHSEAEKMQKKLKHFVTPTLVRDLVELMDRMDR